MARAVEVHAERVEVEHDRLIALAWHTANFSAATRGKSSRLKPLASYLRRRRPAPEVSQAEIDQALDAAREWADELNRR